VPGGGSGIGRATALELASGARVAAVSRVAAAHPEIAEGEVNPLLALPDGALGLDARVVRAERAA
jgi:acetate---CoA ligase (ADP-forming)